MTYLKNTANQSVNQSLITKTGLDFGEEPAGDPLADGLLLRHSFTEVTGAVTDNVASLTNDGNLLSMTMQDNRVPGPFAGVYGVGRDGSGDLINCGSLGLGDASQTLACWVKGSTDPQMFMMSSRDATKGGLSMYTSGDSLYAMIGVTPQSSHPGAAIWDDTWHHIAIVYNKSAGEIRFYVDGVHLLTDTTLDGLGTWDSTVDTQLFGRVGSSGASVFEIADPRIYNIAQDNAGITSIYNWRPTASTLDAVTVGIALNNGAYFPGLGTLSLTPKGRIDYSPTQAETVAESARLEFGHPDAFGIAALTVGFTTPPLTTTDLTPIADDAASAKTAAEAAANQTTEQELAEAVLTGIEFSPEIEAITDSPPLDAEATKQAAEEAITAKVTDDTIPGKGDVGGGSGQPEDGPYDPRPVAPTYTRCPAGGSSIAAGYCDNPISLPLGDSGRIGIDFSLLSASEIKKVKSVSVAAWNSEGVIIETWVVAQFNTLAGGAWEHLASVTLAGFAAGDTAEVTVVITNQDGFDRTAVISVRGPVV